VDFSQSTVGLDFTIGIAGRSFGITGGAPITGSGFSGRTSSGPGPGTLTASGCVTGCAASVSGFFAGANAERAGVGYSISDDKSVVGAAAFMRQ